jgi:polar amino acid transport system substrate-binding protein
VRRTVWLLIAACALGPAAAGCGDDDDAGGASSGSSEAAVKPPASVSEAGVFTVCTDPTYPPAEFKEGAELKGFDIDISNAIAESFGVEARFVETGFDGLIAAVQGRKCDAAIAAMTVTPEREKTVSFVVYGRTGFGLMVPKGNPDGITGLDDLAGRTAAVQLGTTQRDLLLETSAKFEEEGKEKIDVKTFPKDTDAAAALQAGKVDAYFADGAPVSYYVKRNPDSFEIAANNIAEDPTGIALRRDDSELRQALQRTVDSLYASARMQEIFASWGVRQAALEQ